MSRLDRQKENHAIKADQLRDNRDEGTAARTRPFSFEEIMKRRKHKELFESMKKEVGGVEIISNSDTIQDPLRGGRKTKRLSSVIERPVLEEHVRVSHRSKEDSLHMREEKSIQGISSRSRHDLQELRYKEKHASSKEGVHVQGNRNREPEAELRSNPINEVWSRDNRGEIEKKICSMNKNGEWQRGDAEDRRLRSEIRNVGYRAETEQKNHSGGKNSEQPGGYREDRGQRNELRNRGSRVETDKKTHSRSKNNEWPRNNTENWAPCNEQYETDKRIHRSKDDEWPRNDSYDRAHKAYSRDSAVNDRFADTGEGKLENESKRKHRSVNDRDIREKNPLKKPDFGRSSHSQVAEKGRKELPRSRHEDSRMKRKRSRSQDHGKNREKRSVSLSPAAQKNMSYNGRKLGDSFSHSLKDRPGKQHKEIERSKFSSNGSGNHCRGLGGLTSELGGYSPRKRKTENSVKTPSPTNRSLERKSAGLDIPTTGVKDSSTGSVTHVPQPSNHQAVSLNVHKLVSAVTAALNASKPLPGGSGIFPVKNNASIDSIQLTESTRPMRQLYVENTPASASEKDLMEYLNNHLLSSGVNHIQGKQPCISCIINKDKHQALVEFLTPEDASEALSFDGSSFSGSVLKIRRRKDFVEVATGNTVETAKSAVTVPLSNIVEDSPHKVFIGGISEALSTEMLIEIASAFGPLKAFYFDTTQDSLNQYGFLEYIDQSVTTKACAGLNGMKLGGQVLTVVQALPYTLPMEISERQPTYVIPDHAKPLLQKSTQVVKLKNVFTPEDMFSLSKLEIDEVLEDIRLECARFGTVKSLNVVEQGTVPLNDLEETCGVHNDDKFAETGENLGHGGKIFSETSGVVVKTATEEFREGDVDRDLGEKVEQDYAVEPKSIGLEENINDVIRDEDDAPKQLVIKVGSSDLTTDSPSPASSKQRRVLVDHIECPESKESETSQTKEVVDDSKVSAGNEELNSEEGKSSSREAIAGLGFSQNVETKEQDSELGRIFELGSVFVEYKRTEGSCIAAHALHGRLFDERVVMVEFIPLELYQARFLR